ncbi:MAG TPA: hypothetical protein VFO77_04985 [Actinoplanes sp.]|nr:hypothetical protein [Actinoplanes sp.]
MNPLERRYLRLVRLCYPAGYRDERGTEIVGTYLALSSPQRRWPSPADVADLAAAGLRQHLRAGRATDIGAGLQLAAVLALATATALAAGWTMLELNPWRMAWLGFEQHGAAVSPGIAVWAAWLLPAAVQAMAPGRWTRLTIGLALTITVAVVPVAAALHQQRPPVFVLLAQVCLGLVALGLPGRPPRWQRLLPFTPAAVALLGAVVVARYGGDGYYGWPAGHVLPGAGAALLVLTLLVAVRLVARNDLRGGWALLALLGPIGVLCAHPLAAQLAVAWYGYGPNADTAMLTAAVTIVMVTVATAVLVALVVRRRLGTRAARSGS